MEASGQPGTIVNVFTIGGVGHKIHNYDSGPLVGEKNGYVTYIGKSGSELTVPKSSTLFFPSGGEIVA